MELDLALVAPIVVALADGDVFTTRHRVTPAEVECPLVIVPIGVDNAHLLGVTLLELPADGERAIGGAILANLHFILEVRLLANNRLQALPNPLLLIVGEDATRDERILADLLAVDELGVVVPLLGLTHEVADRLPAHPFEQLDNLFLRNHLAPFPQPKQAPGEREL